LYRLYGPLSLNKGCALPLSGFIMTLLRNDPTYRVLSVLAATASLMIACSDDATEPVVDADIGVDTGSVAADAQLDITLDTGVDGGAPDTERPDTLDAAPDALDVMDQDGPDAALDDTDGGVIEPSERRCDALDPAFCSYPWPSSLYLVADENRPSGYRLDLADSLPTNRTGEQLDAALFAHLDGYSLGSPIMTVIPGVDIDGFPTEDDIGRSMDEDSPSLLFAVTPDGLTRVPHWVELDGTANEREEPTLFMRPAVFLSDNTQYIVAYRGVTDGAGAPVVSSDAFAALRDGLTSDLPWVGERAEAFETLFTLLSDSGVAREDLYLAWSFHTGSYESIQRRVLQATELVIDAIGDEGAALRFEEVEEFVKVADDSGLRQNSNMAYSIDATMTTPAVAEPRSSGDGFQLVLDENGDVARAENDLEVNVWISVPHRAALGEEVGVIVYGHGMLGEAWEIFADHLQRITEELGYVMIATPMRGMSADDNLGVLTITFDLNNFGVIGDGLVQGVAQTHALARTSITRLPGLLAELDEDIVIDPDRLYWFGGSQGGIFGPTIIATSPDIARGGLAVPGNNYSTLLSRSINFDRFFQQLDVAYAGSYDVNVGVAAVQLLWDHTDPISWWERLLTTQTPDGRQREALLLLSKADKQVAVVTNEVLSRTFPEVAVMAPYDVTRSPWGIEETDYPHMGSGTVLFDFGNPWPAGRGNLPPNDELPDPHPRISEVNAAGALLEAFFDRGEIIDVCGGDGCTPD
jgi:hypothetical protein